MSSQPDYLQNKDTNLDIAVLELPDNFIDHLKSKGIYTIADLLKRLRYFRNGGLVDIPGGFRESYQDLIVNLFNRGYIDRLEAGLVLKTVNIQNTESIIISLIGENNSEKYPSVSIDTLNLSTIYHNVLKRKKYHLVGYVKYQLLHGTDEFPVIGIGKKGILEIITGLKSMNLLSAKEEDLVYEQYKLNKEG